MTARQSRLFPFTRDKWALLDSETLKEGRITEEEGGVYISRFTRDEPAYKEFEAGYDESEALASSLCLTDRR